VHDLGSDTVKINAGFPGLKASRDSIRRHPYGSQTRLEFCINKNYSISNEQRIRLFIQKEHFKHISQKWQLKPKNPVLANHAIDWIIWSKVKSYVFSSLVTKDAVLGLVSELLTMTLFGNKNPLNHYTWSVKRRLHWISPQTTFGSSDPLSCCDNHGHSTPQPSLTPQLTVFTEKWNLRRRNSVLFSSSSVQTSVGGRGNEHSGFIKYGIFRDQLNDHQLLNRSAP
jgi:hypothetical protein